MLRVCNLERDYWNNSEIFEVVAQNYKLQDSVIIEKEGYDKNDPNLVIIFENLHFDHIRVSKENVFFCKGHSGLDGYGLISISNFTWIAPVKSTRVKAIEDSWYIYTEHPL